VGTDGTVFFGTQDGQMHALNANGSLRWRYRTGARIRSSPAVGTDGVVYFGSDDRGIYAIGPDGQRRWAAQAADLVTASPVIAPDGTILVGSLDRRLYALRPDGTKRWDFLAESAVHGSACVGADGMIYFGTYNGWVYALNQNGAPTWAFNSATNPVSGGVFNSPLLLNDRLLVPLSSGGIQALSVTAGPADVNWPQYRRDAQRSARAKAWLAFALPPSATGLIAGESLSLGASFTLPNRSITRVELLSDARVVATANETNAITWSGVSAGMHALSLRVVDNAGNVHLSPTSNLEVAPTPKIEMGAAASGGWRFNCETLVGRQYQLELSTNLPSWSPVGGPMLATNTIQVWTEASRPSGGAYYRVRVQP
jgi:hypothetical protein